MSRTSLTRAQGVRDSTEQRVTENYAATLAERLFQKEAADRKAADDTLLDRIISEEEARAAADTRLTSYFQNTIRQEKNERIRADQSLGSEIDVAVKEFRKWKGIYYAATDGHKIIKTVETGELFALINDTGEDITSIPNAYPLTAAIPDGAMAVCKLTPLNNVEVLQLTNETGAIPAPADILALEWI